MPNNNPPPLPQPNQITGGYPYPINIFPPDYPGYVDMMGYDPWMDKPTLAGSMFNWQKILQESSLTGQYNGAPTFEWQKWQDQMGMDQKQLDMSKVIAEIQAGASKYGADKSAEASMYAANIQKQIAEMQNAVDWFTAEATKNYQEGLLKIQQGQLDLGYAQLEESKRQFDEAHKLDQQKFALMQEEFKFNKGMAVAQLQANPKNWIALSYAAKNQTIPQWAYEQNPDPIAIMNGGPTGGGAH